MPGRLPPPPLALLLAAVTVAVCLTAPVLLVHGAETEAEAQAQAQAQAAVAELSRPDVDNFCRAGCAWIVIEKRGVVRPPVSRELGAALASMHLPDPAESVGSGSESLVAQAAEWYNKAAPTVSKLVSEADLSTCVHDCRVVNLYSHDEIMGNNNEDEAPPPPQPQWPVRPAATRPAARRLIGVKGVGKQSRAKKEALSFPQGIAQKRARVGRAVVVRGNTPFVRITDVNGRPLSPRTAKLVSSVIMSHQRGVDLKRPLKGPRSGALVRVDRQHQLQPEASAASESESDSDSSLGGASHYPRFSSVLSRLHVQHQLNQQSLSMALAEVYVWHFTSAATGAAIDTRYKVGMTRFSRKCKTNRYQWQARVAESIRQGLVAGLGYSYAIDRIYRFAADAIEVEKRVHDRLDLSGFPRWVTVAPAAAKAAEKARRRSGITEVFDMVAPAPAFQFPLVPGRPPTADALVYLDDLIQTNGFDLALPVCGVPSPIVPAPATSAPCQNVIAPAIGCPPIGMCPNGCN